MRLTDEGLRNFRDIVAEWHQNIQAGGQPKAGSAVDRGGGRIIGAWMTQGAYDAVMVAEFPDAESANLSRIISSMRGNWRGEQMRAFTVEEMQQIVQRLT